MAPQPEDPQADAWLPQKKGAKEPQLHLLKLLPNLVSILALCAGLTAIRFAISGRISEAVFLIALAAALDGLDGRLARMLKSESDIGAELDSLCDFVNFGVVPGIVLYLWGLSSEIQIGWIAVLVYAVCCMLRLARFNVGNRLAAPAETSAFIGVPSPAGAMLALLPIYLSHVTDYRLPALFVAAWMVAIGALMISRLPTPSMKRATVAASWARYVLVFGVVVIASLFTYPWVTLLVLSLCYLGAILSLALAGLRRKRRN
ncbi:CDP-diacylglycerol--serine O-phosphatidyltransferase [Xinfangfangia sp. CPCC 101601]|uniref:CDP-diacylglycerol--serine O-phosphatidyltransferase n=1 Tax=Pseudogemmobacter lacusdianii TaxID=3069608 RepID=A0ABU0VY25_9RHOB|nr:CDP-diacylglycerol--serine O-phosphatidyltransferase [Xinfangfangia sp. CPCC 101601]MDQ2065805.1 CDP-diacylglycerol--serine O-phosphatidyltransferase [Xinfangfangia sp. CPCC 101601]